MNVLQSLTNRINALKFRERAMILLAFLAVVGFVGETYFLAPARQELAREKKRIADQQNRRQELQAQEVRLRQRLEEDLDARNRQRIQDLRAEIAKEEKRLHAELDNLVSPVEMNRVLRDFVPADGRLRLERVRSLPSSALNIGAGEDAPRLYRRGVELELQGEFLALLDYLRAIEASPWRLHWDVLRLNISEYPVCEIRLRVFTLSIEPGWIGI
jgi:MSHA biogenesis protein MshJ